MENTTTEIKTSTQLRKELRQLIIDKAGFIAAVKQKKIDIANAQAAELRARAAELRARAAAIDAAKLAAAKTPAPNSGTEGSAAFVDNEVTQ